MGKGKGAAEVWVAVIRPGNMLFEVGGVPRISAREACVSPPTSSASAPASSSRHAHPESISTETSQANEDQGTSRTDDRRTRSPAPRAQAGDASTCASRRPPASWKTARPHPPDEGSGPHPDHSRRTPARHPPAASAATDPQSAAKSPAKKPGRRARRRNPARKPPPRRTNPPARTQIMSEETASPATDRPNAPPCAKPASAWSSPTRWTRPSSSRWSAAFPTRASTRSSA